MANTDLQKLRLAIMEYSDRVLYRRAAAAIEQLMQKTGDLPPSSQIHGIHQRSMAVRDPNLIWNIEEEATTENTFQSYLNAKIFRERTRLFREVESSRDRNVNSSKTKPLERNLAYFEWVRESTFKDKAAPPDQRTAPKRAVSHLIKSLDLPKTDKDLRARGQVLMFELWMSHVFSQSIPHADTRN